MKIWIVAVLLVLVVYTQPLAAQETIKCSSCRPVTIELESPRAMLEFVIYAQYSDTQRKKVLDQLVSWVIESKEYDLALALADRFDGMYAGQKTLGSLMEKTDILRVRTFLVSTDVPSKLVRAMHFLRHQQAYNITERELICTKVLKGTDMEVLEGYGAGCRFGYYIDVLRARIFASKDNKFVTAASKTELLTYEEVRSIKY